MSDSTLRFLGFELELLVECILDSDGYGPRLCSARDLTQQQWLIVKVDDDPDHLAWICAPASSRAVEAVKMGQATLRDTVRHSFTGTVELVVIDHGRAVPDCCLLCGSIPEHLLPASEMRVLVAA